MTKSSCKLIYALKNDKVTHISEVESGIKCGCICPACGESLIARKGQKMTHHFAHKADTNCEYGYESSLHYAAKEILSKAEYITIPEVVLRFPGSYKEIPLAEPKRIKIDKVEIERKFHEIVPDVVIYSGSKKLFVEIYVTHSIDDIKFEKIKAADISTIEIDLSKKREIITDEELTEMLVCESPQKKWVYNKYENDWLLQFRKVSDRKKIIQRGFAQHIDGCPIAMRTWKGKKYANYFDDCIECEYCIGLSEDGDDMYCSGRMKVSELTDLK